MAYDVWMSWALARQSVLLPQPEPRVLSMHFVMLLVGGLAIGGSEYSPVWKRVNALQPFYLGNGFLQIHAVPHLDASESDLV